MGRRSSLVGVFATVELALGVLGASAASAAPVWKFNGAALVGAETVTMTANATLPVPGGQVTCNVTQEVKVANNEGAGSAEAKTLTSKECMTVPGCTVAKFEAVLPWSGQLATVEGSDYLVFEKVIFTVTYAGEECPFLGTPVTVRGKVGGLVENAKHTVVFSKESARATNAFLKIGARNLEWQGTYSTEATGAHKGEGLEG